VEKALQAYFEKHPEVLDEAFIYARHETILREEKAIRDLQKLLSEHEATITVEREQLPAPALARHFAQNRENSY
jgi:hypothetical protein